MEILSLEKLRRVQVRKRAVARRRFITSERSFHVAVHVLNREAPRGAAARLMTSAADGKNHRPVFEA